MNQPSSLEQRMVELEMRLTYQQKLIDDLNGVVTEQTMKILKLETRLGNVVQQNEQLGTLLRESLPNLPQEKPPHY